MNSPLHLNLGRRISDFGARRNIPWLVENPLTFRYYHRLARENAPGVVDAFEALFPEARRYADVGAGSGTFAAEARRRGHPVEACEYSPIGRAFARLQGVHPQPFDLERDPPASLTGPFDLAYSFEVAQQVPEQGGMRMVSFLSGLAPLVVFSSGQPGQGGVGVHNFQPKSYWIDAFAERGMRHREDLSKAIAEEFARSGVQAPWLLENVIVLESDER
jgi:SAM-dependent methyltransferase